MRVVRLLSFRRILGAIKLAQWLSALATCLLLAASGTVAQPLKMLSYAFPVAESDLGPDQLSELYSRADAASIFEAPLLDDNLARPSVLKVRSAASMHKICGDDRRFIFCIRTGICLAEDPAFTNQKLDLAAANHVCSLKSHCVPKFESLNLVQLKNSILGLCEPRQQDIVDSRPFPYSTKVDGLRMIDSYTLEVLRANPARVLLATSAPTLQSSTRWREF